MNTFNIQNITLGGDDLFFILGPCAIESEEFTWQMARDIKVIADKLNVPFFFKASYDKANRTAANSYRGPGPKEGCALLGAIGKELGVPVTTDIHTPEDAEIAAEHIDFLQIPAFLCRQTDLLEAAAKTGRGVNEVVNRREIVKEAAAEFFFLQEFVENNKHDARDCCEGEGAEGENGESSMGFAPCLGAFNMLGLQAHHPRNERDNLKHDNHGSGEESK